MSTAPKPRAIATKPVVVQAPAKASLPQTAGPIRFTSDASRTEPQPPPENVAFIDEFAAQERRNRQRDIETGALLFSDEICASLGITMHTLNQAVREQRMFALESPSGEPAYPAFFADPRLDRPKLEQISRALGDLPGASKYGFFTTPKISLKSRSPLEFLAAGGDMQSLLKTARGHRER